MLLENNKPPEVTEMPHEVFMCHFCCGCKKTVFDNLGECLAILATIFAQKKGDGECAVKYFVSDMTASPAT